MTTDTADHDKAGLVVIAHGADEMHLVRDAYFASWGHVHLSKPGEHGPGGKLHLECEHSLTEVVAATPRDEQMRPVMAQASLLVDLIRDIENNLVHQAVDERDRLRDLTPRQLTALVEQADEAAETLSVLSAGLAAVLIGEPHSLSDRPGADQATKAALTAIVVHDDLRNLIDLATHTTPPSPRPSVGRNQPCPCGSGRKYKHCCGANT